MANVITPRFWKKKAILIKSEVTYGTDAVPTGAANWIEARDVSFTPYDISLADRNIDLPWMGNAGKAIVSKWAKLSFKVVAAGSGVAGTAPKWGPLALICGMAETISAGVSAAYNLVSSAFGSADVYVNVDGIYWKLIGSRGNMKYAQSAKGVPMLQFDLDCLYVAPIDSAMPAVTRTGWGYDEATNSVNTTAFSINAVALAMSEFNWDCGNKIARIDLPGPQLEVAISERDPSASATVLAPLLAVFNPFTLADAGTNVAVTCTHGSAAGKKVKSDLKAVITNVENTEVEGISAWKLTMEPTPVNGNDEIALTNI